MRRLQRWLAARTEEGAAAAAIAAFLYGGAAGPKLALSTALQRLTCVRFDDLTPAIFDDSQPWEALVDTPCGFGDIDAFVSHAWADGQAQSKYAAL
eukprot:CAMPEP_0206058814 /NCGR_PEP_ID=MMETSP1466-20131121/47512_1 /ASSEMBLY_ACC=CAM_ASM_001126 /TAXON_ID=44452 /ORGANISM="Pavlova gyrans, Strain CCMP608" /LENGTH=95 /DNA_ID=CAMNT_0053434115 /DNA_START=1 /DNA_END=284 /DNA_ORIENTATION=+